MNEQDDISNDADIESRQNLPECNNESDEADQYDQDTSKHLSKRLLRKMKKHKNWLERLPEKRAKEKLKKKQRRREAIERGESLGPTRKMLKLNSMAKSSCKIKVALDCSFDQYMGDKDIMKLTKQVGFCYSANRRADNPLQFYVCGVHGQMKQRFESIGDYQKWDVNFTDKDYFEEFEKEKIVYLTSDSPNMLEDLSEDHVYIIGGLVDHNHHKGLCYQLAVERGLAHAQLPIGQYVTMKSRKILTVNHVFEILLKYTETKDWKTSFFSIIPQRKVDKDTPVSQTDVKVDKDTPVLPTDVKVDKDTPVLPTDVKVDKDTPVLQTDVKVDKDTPVLPTDVKVDKDTPVLQTDVKVNKDTPVSQTDVKVIKGTTVGETDVQESLSINCKNSNVVNSQDSLTCSTNTGTCSSGQDNDLCVQTDIIVNSDICDTDTPQCSGD